MAEKLYTQADLEELLRQEQVEVLKDVIGLLQHREGYHGAWAEPIRLLQAELKKAQEALHQNRAASK